MQARGKVDLRSTQNEIEINSNIKRVFIKSGTDTDIRGGTKITLGAAIIEIAAGAIVLSADTIEFRKKKTP